MKAKKYLIALFIVIGAVFSVLPAQENTEKTEPVLQQYYGQTFHGNMMGKIITADINIVDNTTIDFTANLPSGKKPHTYTYEIISEEENRIITQWYENGKPDKTVTFTSFQSDGFVMEVKGKGKVKMQKI